MFTQSCFIRKDTQELRDKLKEIGLEPHPCIAPKTGTYIFVNRGFYSGNEIGYQEEIEKAIDCGENEELFLAIAALRDDNDFMQYFKAAEADRLLLCRVKYIEDCTTLHELYRKLTPEELIEHFNHE